MSNLVIIKNTKKEFIEVNNDYTLPDYIADIRNIVSCDSICRINNVFINGNNITYDGEIVHNLLVICEDETINSVVYTEDFSINGSLPDNTTVGCHEGKIETSTVRLISPRKINCKARSTVFSVLYEDVNTEVKCTGEIEVDVSKDIEKRNTEYECMSISENVLKMQHSSHDIDIGAEKQEVANIVYCKVNTNINERKYTEGKLFIRGESCIEVLYETVNSSYSLLREKIPFSDIVDNIEEAKGYICNIVVRDVKAVVRNNSFGEMKRLEIDYTYDINCRIYRAYIADITDDMYSTEHECENKHSSITANKLNSITFGSLSVDDSIELDKIFENGIKDIVVCHGAVTNAETQYKDDRFVVCGNIKYDIIAIGDSLCHLVHTTSFRYEHEYDGPKENNYDEIYISLTECNAEILKGKILVTSELELSVMIAETAECRYISESRLNVSQHSSLPSMIIYYPEKGESVWAVAKKFKTKVANIMVTNNLKDESLDGIKVLLLPRRKQKAVMNRII